MATNTIWPEFSTRRDHLPFGTVFLAEIHRW
jgi:hypothetical protein